MIAARRSSQSEMQLIGLLLFFVIFAQHVPWYHCQGIPTMACTSMTGSQATPEDSPIGTKIAELEGTVHDGSYPSVNLTGFTFGDTSTAALVNLTQPVYDVGSDVWRSDVILIGNLEADKPNGGSEAKLDFWALDSNGNRNRFKCELIIGDVNDNAPTFLGLPYVIGVTENTTVGTLLFSLTATDPDTPGRPFTISAKFFDSEVDAVFNTSSITFGSEAVMNITLAQPLDYETRTSYSFELIAADQGLNNTALVKVDVIDVQDTPPIFLLRSYRAAIRENEPAGTYVIKVSAEDGDRDPPNDISYSIVSGNPDYFTMDNMTGEITSQVILDRDNFTLVGSEGFFQLVVRASEIPGTTPQYGNTTTDVTVVVVVEDVNDNTPTFASSAPYTAYVREDVAVDSLIYFAGDGYISVSDADQGRNSHFNLTVERDGLPWPMLEATPSDVFSEAVVLLRVLNADVFRNAADTQLTLQLVAREMSTGERYSSTAEVVIAVAKMEEQPTTPLPIVDNSTTASDVVVFIIGFLVIFNIAATVFIVWFLRRRSPEPKQGLVRKGSKYYVNGVETTVRSSGFQDGSAVTLRPESIMVELEGKDRCDVVPLSAVRNENKRLSQASSALSSKANGFQRNSSGPSCDMGDGSGNTERKVLVANEVSPATKSVNPKIVITKADVTSSATGSPTTTTTTTTTTSTASPLPDFSKAKRNVSTPQNPSLSFANPPTTTSASSSTASFQLAPAAFPSANAAAPTATTTTTTTSAADATASSTVEPVTRFSAKGAVSTTVTSVPDYVTVATVSRSSNDASAHASTKAEGGESMSEMLY